MVRREIFHAHTDYPLREVGWLAIRWMGKQVRQYYLLMLFLLLLPVMFSRTNGNPRVALWSDSEGYYQYLPAAFIIRDFHRLPPGSVWPYYNDKGEYVIKYTCGIAYFELPFFLFAYGFSEALGYDPLDYFNPLYCKSAAVCGFFMTFLGLWFLQKVLRRMVSPAISFWVIVSVILGTNLFHYLTKDMNGSHVFNFFLFSFLLYHLPAYLKKPDLKNSLLLGAILGWIILIRPINGMVGLVLPLYDVYSWHECKLRFHFFFQRMASVLWIILGAIPFFIPQLLYWKEMTGSWLYYSYTTEGFTYWNQPKIAAVLFDVQNGLFLYSPLVLFMVAGIFRGIIKKNFQGPVMLLVFSLATYVFASWWAWWFGGAFGHRCYVEYYALLAIPLAGLYQWVSTGWSAILKYTFFALMIVLMAFSVRLSFLYTSLPGPWDGPDWRWNWEKYEWILSHLI